jgi:hypothetical protein
MAAAEVSEALARHLPLRSTNHASIILSSVAGLLNRFIV